MARRGTRAEQAARSAAIAHAEATAQGLPPVADDPAAYARLARILATPTQEATAA